MRQSHSQELGPLTEPFSSYLCLSFSSRLQYSNILVCLSLTQHLLVAISDSWTSLFIGLQSHAPSYVMCNLWAPVPSVLPLLKFLFELSVTPVSFLTIFPSTNRKCHQLSRIWSSCVSLLPSLWPLRLCAPNIVLVSQSLKRFVTFCSQPVPHVGFPLSDCYIPQEFDEGSYVAFLEDCKRSVTFFLRTVRG
jgi:hypothetical protein